MSTSQIYFKTKLGPVSIVEKNKKVIYINFKRTKSKKINYRLINLKKKILLYLSGKIKKISGKFKIEGSKKQMQIWNVIRKIPYGNTWSYKKISKIVKTSPRYIGKVCSQNKILLFIPCHRVINRNGELGGFSGTGGIKLKKKLLKVENKLLNSFI